MKNINELLEEFSLAFGKKTRTNGKEFWFLKDDAPEWMTDIVYKCHDSGEILPNDEIYSAIMDILDHLINYDLREEDNICEFIYEISPPTHYELKTWLLEFNDADTYTDEEYECHTNIMDALQCGHFKWIESLSWTIINGLQEREGALTAL